MKILLVQNRLRSPISLFLKQKMSVFPLRILVNRVHCTFENGNELGKTHKKKVFFLVVGPLRGGGGNPPDH